jgi:hypothetical protein
MSQNLSHPNPHKVRKRQSDYLRETFFKEVLESEYQEEKIVLRNCPRASSQLPGSCVNNNRVATIHIVPLMVEQDDANQLGSSDQPKNDNLGDFVGSLAPQRDADINVGLLGDGGSTEHRTENKQHVAEEVQESMTLRFVDQSNF